MPGDEKRPIFTDRLVVPIAGVVAAFLVIAPGIFWASNTTTRMNAHDQQIAELKILLQRNEEDDTKDSIRLTIVETNYASVLQTLTEIKVSLKKLEERFNLK